MNLRIERLDGRALVEDLGRPGFAHLGITGAGAADRGSLQRANARVGNARGAAAIELTGSLVLRADSDTLIALAGARERAATAVAAGEHVHVPVPERGVRTYVAVRGGLDIAPLLGSASTDTLAGLGPAPLATGDDLSVGRDLGALRTIDPAAAPSPAGSVPGPLLMLSVHPGPRLDWIGSPAALFSAEYRVGRDSDRVGVRLDGPALTRARAGELPSEGLVRGAVQIPPDGRPVVFGPDHPVTGGYPVVAVLTDAASDALAQARPGQAVRFRRTGSWPRT